MGLALVLAVTPLFVSSVHGANDIEPLAHVDAVCEPDPEVKQRARERLNRYDPGDDAFEAGVLKQFSEAWFEGQRDRVELYFEAGIAGHHEARGNLFHVAAEHGWVELTELAIECGVDLEQTSSVGLPPLQEAVARGHLDIVKALVEAGADINATSAVGRTALHFAVDADRVPIIEYLLGHQPDLSIRDDYHYTVLHLAAGIGNKEIVERLIRGGADLNNRDVQGNTILHTAAIEGHLEVVELLLEHGASLESIESEDWGWTPLHAAAGFGHPRIAERLIEAGISPNQKDRLGWAPIHLAASSGSLETTQVLIREGGDVNIRNMADVTPLHGAALEGHLDILEYLIAQGADRNAVDWDGMNVLHTAADGGQAELVEWLIFEGGLEVDVRDAGGRTPLHLAALRGHSGVTEVLMERGAQVGASDKHGNTPLDLATLFRHSAVIDLLESAETERSVSVFLHPVDPDTDPELEFNRYPVEERTCEIDSNEVPDDPRSQRNAAELNRLADQPANFAGCWRVVEVGCGTACQKIGVLHLDSGKVIWGPTASYGVDFRLDSRLLVVNPPGAIDHYGENRPDWLVTKYLYLDL